MKRVREMEPGAAVKILGALAHETRLAVFRLLVTQGQQGLSVGQIGETLQVAGATLSFHLKELALARLIVPRQEGRFTFYTANFDEVESLLEFLTGNCCSAPGCDDPPAASGEREFFRRTQSS